MTAASLRTRSAKDLAQLARQHGISGWHSMRKEELVQALLANAPHGNRPPLGDAGRMRTKRSAASRTTNRTGAGTHPKIRKSIIELQQKMANLKSLANASTESSAAFKEDTLVVMVRDPYWLHASWCLSQKSIERAQAAMGQRWHNCQPTLRLYRMLEAGTAEHERDVPVHGGVSHWYVDVVDPPCEFRMEIGYLAEDGWFYTLARSNTVQTPSANSRDKVDDNWSDVARNADMIFAMSGGYSPQGTSRELQELLEERLRRPLGTPMNTRFGHGAALGAEQRLNLAIDAEVTVYGVTARDAHVTLKGAPIQVRPDGTFSARLKLSEMRQVIPIVASSGDGVEQRTVILALERNTKVMEPIVRDVGRKASR